MTSLPTIKDSRFNKALIEKEQIMKVFYLALIPIYEPSLLLFLKINILIHEGHYYSGLFRCSLSI
ncbi:MAG: hypothetical protein R2828_22940 [Saprospiraceae bacterium]